MKFKDLILSVELSDKEQEYFSYICTNWVVYCKALTSFDKLKVIKLLKYLITERANSKQLLNRCVGRFNRLNALQTEVLK